MNEEKLQQTNPISLEYINNPIEMIKQFDDYYILNLSINVSPDELISILEIMKKNCNVIFKQK
jgi:hypothetical protein